MKLRTSKTVAKVFAFLLVVSVFSSCNRGSGCPNNDFKMSDVIFLPFGK